MCIALRWLDRFVQLLEARCKQPMAIIKREMRKTEAIDWRACASDKIVPDQETKRFLIQPRGKSLFPHHKRYMLDFARGQQRRATLEELYSRTPWDGLDCGAFFPNTTMMTGLDSWMSVKSFTGGNIYSHSPVSWIFVTHSPQWSGSPVLTGRVKGYLKILKPPALYIFC